MTLAAAWRLKTVLILGPVLLTSCDPGQPYSVGVYDGGESVRILSGELCPDERIVAITVYAVEGNVVGDSDDRVLWAAAGTQGTRHTDMTMGVPPPGFVESEEFSGLLPGDSGLVVLVDTTLTQRLSETFEASSLRANEVLTVDGYVPLAEFRSQQPLGCG
ncbi:MAG: hypothetical protein ACRDT7_10145 [Microbacterium sp.]